MTFEWLLLIVDVTDVPLQVRRYAKRSVTVFASKKKQEEKKLFISNWNNNQNKGEKAFHKMIVQNTLQTLNSPLFSSFLDLLITIDSIPLQLQSKAKLSLT